MDVVCFNRLVEAVAGEGEGGGWDDIVFMVHRDTLRAFVDGTVHCDSRVGFISIYFDRIGMDLEIDITVTEISRMCDQVETRLPPCWVEGFPRDFRSWSRDSWSCDTFTLVLSNECVPKTHM